MSALSHRANSVVIPGCQEALSLLQLKGFVQYLKSVRDKDNISASAFLKKGAVFLAWSCDGVMPENLIVYLRYHSSIYLSIFLSDYLPNILILIAY